MSQSFQFSMKSDLAFFRAYDESNKLKFRNTFVQFNANFYSPSQEIVHLWENFWNWLKIFYNLFLILAHLTFFFCRWLNVKAIMLNQPSSLALPMMLPWSCVKPLLPLFTFWNVKGDFTSFFINLIFFLIGLFWFHEFFYSVDEAIEWNNEVEQGLSSSLFTQNIGNIFKVSKKDLYF